MHPRHEVTHAGRRFNDEHTIGVDHGEFGSRGGRERERPTQIRLVPTTGLPVCLGDGDRDRGRVLVPLAIRELVDLTARGEQGQPGQHPDSDQGDGDERDSESRREATDDALRHRRPAPGGILRRGR